MIMTLYEYPLPNNGERYDLSKDELDDLLYKAYRSGFEHARDVYDPSKQGVTTWASYEDIDDNTRWKEVWTK